MKKKKRKEKQRKEEQPQHSFSILSRFHCAIIFSNDNHRARPFASSRQVEIASLFAGSENDRGRREPTTQPDHF